MKTGLRRKTNRERRILVKKVLELTGNDTEKIR